MDTNTIILILVGLVAVGLIYRSVSSKPEKTTGESQPAPSQPDQEQLLSLTKAQLVELASDLGVTVAKSHTKSKIVQTIINASNLN